MAKSECKAFSVEDKVDINRKTENRSNEAISVIFIDYKLSKATGGTMRKNRDSVISTHKKSHEWAPKTSQ